MEALPYKAKVIILAKVKERRQSCKPNKTETRHEARENACEGVMIAFGFVSDWLTKWCEFLRPITKRNRAVFK